VCVAFVRNPRTFGAVRLLLSVIVIVSSRNIIENLYFGLYFGGQYGLFPASIVGVLGNPGYLILPKVMNVMAASAVFGLLVLRWLPLASKERADADATVHEKMEALNRLAHFDQLTGLVASSRTARRLVSQAARMPLPPRACRSASERRPPRPRSRSTRWRRLTAS
jgi:hypothetical protein